MTKQKLRTIHEYKAYYPDGDPNHVGWGDTAAEALADLERLDRERDESRMQYCPRCAQPTLHDCGVEWPYCRCP